MDQVRWSVNNERTSEAKLPGFALSLMLFYLINAELPEIEHVKQGFCLLLKYGFAGVSFSNETQDRT